MQNLFFVTQNLFNRGISRLSALLFLAAALAALQGCGSGEALPSPPPPPSSTTGPVAASIQLLASSTQMASAGTVAVDLTAIVLSATKQTISGKTVTFSTGSNVETAFINNISGSGVSDANGIVTARLNLGSDKTNRTIPISAMVTEDSVTATNSVDVVGTTVTISGDTSVARTAKAKLAINVKDSAGSPLQGIPVTVTSGKLNTVVLTPSNGTTPSSGQVSVEVTADNPGDDTIKATAIGPSPTAIETSATQTLIVSSASFAFTSPAAGTEIRLGDTQPFTLQWTDVPAPTGNVTFSPSRGTVFGGNVTASSSSLVSGIAGASISSTTAGPATITATGPGGTPSATLDVVFVATSASSATVQAVPGTVQVAAGSASQTNHRAEISVQVRDAANNLVKNAGVSFSVVDTSGGRLISSSGITNVFGIASVTYEAGATSSAQNGVTITATVNSIGGVPLVPTVTGTTTLTVSGQSLLVRLGTDQLVGGTAPTNTKTYVAIVTDAAGNPSVGSSVNFALRPGRYAKGVWVPDFVNDVWNQVISVTCPNRDLNFNGILDPGEDGGAGMFWINAAGFAVSPHLLPGTIAAVNATAITDANGVATANITYPKDHSYWSEITLEARTSVTTNDPPTQVTFFLPGPALDYNNLTVGPPGNPSPYGFDNSCFDLL